LTPGGTVSVQNKYGEEVVTARTYVKKGFEQKASMTLLRNYESTNTGYKSIFKTNYSYVQPNFTASLLKGVIGAQELTSGNNGLNGNFVKKVYGWDKTKDKLLLKHKSL
jgi:hypothetical protein